MEQATWAQAEAVLGDSELSLAALEWVSAEVNRLGGARLRVARTQVGWARRRGFAYLWSARRWLGARGAECVLSLGMTEACPDSRWKQVVAVRGNLWMHHLEIASIDTLDDQVAGWLAAAYEQAG